MRSGLIVREESFPRLIMEKSDLCVIYLRPSSNIDIYNTGIVRMAVIFRLSGSRLSKTHPVDASGTPYKV